MIERQRGRVELMDHPEAPTLALAHSLADMRQMNWALGWHRPTIRAVQSLLAPGEPCTVLDVATGSGDLPLALHRALTHQGYAPRVIASDMHPTVVALARRHTASRGLILLLQHDANRPPFLPQAVDVVTCASALHHFDEEEAVAFLAACRSLVRRGLVVADVSRSALGLGVV